MRLKQIKLIGFKSFIDPTTLNLDAPLIGIVGPNGCGKSNVIDAVRWVLGESSAKDLRGESMADVIFNGSTSRKPIARAAIELVFDNLEGKLTKEYANFVEISIRREIDRSRQSEYYLNDKKCRRRDITDLFIGTGLSPDGYAIISQGTISKIIESNPKDLRSFVEEAADIAIYKKRRHETELRIQHTEENLTRLRDLINEQTRILEKLEKQQVAAQKYQSYQVEKQDYEYKILIIKIVENKGLLTKYNQEMQQLSLVLEEHCSNKTNIELQLEQYKQQHTEMFDEYSAVQEQYYKLGNAVTKIEQQLQYTKEQQKEISKINKELSADNKQQEDLTTELEVIKQQYIELEQIKNNYEQQYSLAKKAINDWEIKSNQIQSNVLTANNNIERSKSAINQIEVLTKELHLRINKLNQEHSSYNLPELKREILLLEQQLLQQEKIKQEHNTELSLINQEIINKKNKIKDLLQQKNSLQINIQQLSGKTEAIKSLQQDVLAINKNKISWLQKTNLSDNLLFKELSIETGWELALGVVLSQYIDAQLLSNINNIDLALLQDVKDFKLVLVDNNIKNNIKNNNTDNKISILTKINQDFALANILQNVYIIDSLEQALAKRHELEKTEYFVTKNGELVGYNWLFINKADHKAQVLLRDKELNNLTKELNIINNNLDNINIDLNTMEQDLTQLETKQQKMVTHNQSEEDKIRGLVAQSSTKKSNLSNIENRMASILSEIKEYQQKLKDLSTKESSLRNELELAIKNSEQYIKEQETLLAEKLTLQTNIKNSEEASKLAVNNFYNISMKKQDLSNKLDAVIKAKTRLNEQLSILINKQNNLNKSHSLDNSPIESLELELANLLDEQSLKEQKLNNVKIKLNEQENKIAELEQENNNLNISLEQYRSKLEQVKLEHGRISAKLATITEEHNNINIENIENNEEILKQNILELHQKLDYITKKLDRLGPVNLAAIEEFNAETQRKNYLDSQEQDLITALTTLKDAIFKIDNETRKKFRAAFEEINNNFQALFPKLFGGGQAKLELDTDNWLEAGVGVWAQPPGKKNSSIYLLSGGEKALTAVALVFAIFQLNPAPFCILDEVDAPLDDANVVRFSELLLDLSPKVQFIFITHNKTTMQIANQLIGVTMKEPGVSRLVAVNVEQAVAMVE